ncbi:hypothetical protein ACE1TH_02390 [Shouchella sp. JSM 1781072]|uniref:hypothetical protein n=1 Tax=Bacillaceae TaxID=186817 RepID=UPI000C080C8F|nr:hypothetical protein [Bacillus sp. Marseille-P3800]
MQTNRNKKKRLFTPFSFLFHFFKPIKRPSLVLVTNHWNECKNESQQNLCRSLKERGFYASPDYVVDQIAVYVALVPYRVAFLKQQDFLKDKKKIRSLERKGWTVYSISEDYKNEDIHSFLYAFQNQTHTLNNASYSQ